jgi:hypothetical protein
MKLQIFGHIQLTKTMTIVIWITLKLFNSVISYKPLFFFSIKRQIYFSSTFPILFKNYSIKYWRFWVSQLFSILDLWIFFLIVTGFELRVSCLLGRHFTDWTTSPVLQYWI